MDEFIYNHYNESNIKQSRRKWILENTLIYAIEKGINNISFKDISDYLKIERRTLYDYYRNKEELILDLVYVASHRIEAKNSEIFEIFEIAYKDGKAKDTIKLILESIAVIVCVKCYDLALFLIDVDSLYYNIPDKTDENYLKYSKFTGILTGENLFLKNMVIKLIEEEHIEKYSSQELLDVLKESFQAYLTKTIMLTQKTEKQGISNIKIFIDVMITGLVNL